MLFSMRWSNPFRMLWSNRFADALESYRKASETQQHLRGIATSATAGQPFFDED